MTIDEVSIGQRVRVTRAGTPDAGSAENGFHDGLITAIDRAACQVQVELAGLAGKPASITVSPEELDPPVNNQTAGTVIGLHPSTRKPWWQRVAELGATVPPEERAQIPRDAAENLDHYLYGWEKKGA